MDIIKYNNNKIYICGESGGASLTLLTLLEIRNKNLLQPKGCIAMHQPVTCHWNQNLLQKIKNMILYRKYSIYKTDAKVAIGNISGYGRKYNY